MKHKQPDLHTAPTKPGCDDVDSPKAKENEQKPENKKQPDLEDKRKQIPRKVVADIVAREEMTVKFNTIKDIKERSQHDDGDINIAAAPLRISELNDIEAFGKSSDETGGRRKVPKVEIEETTQSNLVAKTREEITNQTLSMEEINDRNNEESSGVEKFEEVDVMILTAIAEKNVEDALIIIGEKEILTVSKNEGEIIKHGVINEEYVAETDPLLTDRKEEINRARQSMLAVRSDFIKRDATVVTAPAVGAVVVVAVIAAMISMFLSNASQNRPILS